MDAKINYNSKWDDEGTHYTQTVTATLTKNQIEVINARLKRLPYFRLPMFAKRFIIAPGLNFVCLTTANTIAEYIGVSESPRYKHDRNTAFNIKVN